MFRLVVLSALCAIALAKPSGIVAPLAYAAAPAIAVPAAVSHQYRTDVISKPVVATYAAAPIVQKAVVAAPLLEKTLVAAPALVAAAPLSSAITHQSRVDLHTPLVASVAYSAPLAHVW